MGLYKQDVLAGDETKHVAAPTCLEEVVDLMFLRHKATASGRHNRKPLLYHQHREYSDHGGKDRSTENDSLPLCYPDQDIFGNEAGQRPSTTLENEKIRICRYET